MTKTDVGQDAVIAFLSNPKSYGAGIDRVERCETHGALVFLAGDRAYKLKRAVRYPYMDFSTQALRRAMCEAELAVNRRAAPTLYLEVRAIVRDESGKLRFGIAAEAAGALDWVVVMRRFEQTQLFESLRQRDKLTPDIMRRAAEAIAGFHRGAEVRHDFGGSAGIRKVIDDNVAILESLVNRPFAHSRIDRFATLARKNHRSLSALLDERQKAGWVRRCHGDMHLNNICLIDGEPVLFDAIEFNEEFACIDTMYDLAFLLMDLEHRKLRPLANVLLNRYLERTADYGGVAALPLFLACRAAVRAHVAATLAEKIAANAREPLLKDAATLLEDAIAFLECPPAEIVVLGGMSGTGKSTLSRNLAPRLGRAPGAVVLRSDVIRKTLSGVDELTRLPQEAYSAVSSVHVYATLAERAAELLAAGHSVIADAVYGRPEERAHIEEVARRLGVTCRALWLDAPLKVLEQRVAARHHDASDATVDVLHRQAAMLEVPANWQKVDVSGTEEQAAAQVAEALNAR